MMDHILLVRLRYGESELSPKNLYKVHHLYGGTCFSVKYKFAANKWETNWFYDFLFLQ